MLLSACQPTVFSIPSVTAERRLWTRHLFVLGNFYPKCTKVYIHVWKNIFSKFMKMNYHIFKTKLNFIYRAAKWQQDLLKSNLNHFEFQAEVDVDTCQVQLNSKWKIERKIENLFSSLKYIFAIQGGYLTINIIMVCHSNRLVKYPMVKFTLKVHVMF